MGFWLSFGAVLLLVAWSRLDPNREPSQKPAGIQRGTMALLERGFRLAKVQLFLSAGMCVLVLPLFGQVALVGPVANLLAIPVFTFWVLPCALLGITAAACSIAGAEWLLKLGALGLAFLIASLDFLSSFSWSTWRPPSAGLIPAMFLAVSVLSATLPRPWPGRLMALVWLGFAGVASLAARTPGPLLSVTVLDVGQGLAVLVRTRNHVLLYDTGTKWPGGDSGNSVVLPTLNRAGIRSLDALVVSHSDADHSGGVQAVADNVELRSAFVSQSETHGLPQVRRCRTGLSWRWDGVRFRFLHPSPGGTWSDNNGSCVLAIDTEEGHSVLLTGDIEAAAEEALLGSHDFASFDLLVAPHHGSRTSSSTAFVTATQPSHVVFSVGYANRWGFPDPAVVSRWKDAGACVISTARYGALEFTSEQRGTMLLEEAARTRFSLPWALREAASPGCADTIISDGGGV